ncbi:MAG TPA: aminotransferase class I/II-fold pyridoxal phosphate-dependent enzyme [Candidatus Limnocylindrales bacterium]|nr:aminotransferase class I/II-fold pyridoxal phosphate-dependent enzyme [Candidatus Limnocylindrales bacterium]
MISRRSFFKTAAVSAAAASLNLPGAELLSWAEPPRETGPNGPILLNSNENPYGPFPSVVGMPNPFLNANRYPDSSYEALVARLAKMHKVTPEHILVGCGSTEALKLATTAFTGPGRKLITATPTFEAVWFYAGATKADIVKIPLSTSYAHNLPLMATEAQKGGGLIYVCNPNNPTASLTPRRTIENFIRELPQGVYVLIDEAYHDLVTVSGDYISFLDQPIENEHVIVTRTFSKIYGMAGLRLGYAVAAPETIRRMAEHRQEDTANIFALRCALKALDSHEEYEAAVQRNTNDRAAFMREAATRKIPVIPSWTNFVMVNALRPVKNVIEHFKQNNIRIGRPFPPMDTFARISLGTPEQMKAFWAAWDKMPKA